MLLSCHYARSRTFGNPVSRHGYGGAWSLAAGRGNIPEGGYCGPCEAGDRLLCGAGEAWRGARPMTRLTGAGDPERPAMPAPPQRAGKTPKRSPLRWLADPRVRLGLGAAAVLVTALLARRDRVGHCEARAFRAVNGLPGSLYGPVWVIMQLGALGAAPAAAGAALLVHDRELAGRLLAAGTGTWALSKLVKQMVRRPRPAALVTRWPVSDTRRAAHHCTGDSARLPGRPGGTGIRPFSRGPCRAGDDQPDLPPGNR